MKQTLILLDAALPVFFRTVRENLAKLVAVFLPINLIIAYAHTRLVERFADGTDIPVSTLLNASIFDGVCKLSVGLIGFTLITRAVWGAVERRTDRNEVCGSLKSAWSRSFGAQLLLLLAAGLALGISVVAFLVCGNIRIAGAIAGGAVFCIGVNMILRLCLATSMSALFCLGPVEALKASFDITRRHVGELVPIAILTGLVTAALVALPEVLYRCDTIGILHPFATGGTAMRFAAGIAKAILGTVVDIAAFYPAAVLSLFIRKQLEDSEEPLQASCRSVILLSVTGLACLVLAGAILVRKDGDILARRKFDPKNIDPKVTELSSRFEMSHFEFLWRREALGRICQEKPLLFDQFSNRRIVWYEIPFCSKCRSCATVSERCNHHEFDTYVFKCLQVGDYHDYKPRHRLAPGFFTWLPSDIRRSMTNDEKLSANAKLKTLREPPEP